MMNPELKAKWVEALRSGKYVQGQHGLRTERNGAEAFCCMGVLCEVMGLERTCEMSEPGYVMPDGSVSSGYVPDELLGGGVVPDELLGGGGVPVPYSRSCPCHLAHMNDTENKTFAEIADWIEANL